MSRGDHGAHEEGGADAASAAADEAFAFPLARTGGSRAQDRRGRRSARRSSAPSSGSSAIRVRAMVGPMPGTEASRSSFSRQAGEPRTVSSISLSRLGELFLERLEQTGDAFLQPLVLGAPLALAFGAHHLDDLAAPGDEIGEQPCCLIGQRPHVAALSPRRSGRSRRHRSGRSWRACRARCAKARTWAGLTTTTGSPAPASAAATTVSKPPVASTAMTAARAPGSRATSSSRPAPLRGTTKALAARAHMHIQPHLRDVDSDNDERPSCPVLA